MPSEEKKRKCMRKKVSSVLQETTYMYKGNSKQMPKERRRRKSRIDMGIYNNNNNNPKKNINSISLFLSHNKNKRKRERERGEEYHMGLLLWFGK